MQDEIELVVLGHKKGVGKDTLASLMVDRLGFVRVSFAAKLKAICRDLFDLDRDHLENHVLKEKIDERYGLTPRQILQKFGTEAVRNQVWDKTWTNYVFKKTIPLLCQNKFTKFVITDCRFKNEIEGTIDFSIKNQGVKIRTTFVEVTRKNDDKKLDHHPSEQDLNSWQGWDFTVVNDKEPIDMYNQFVSKYHNKWK